METSQFDYDLPQELIAQTPVEPRDASRLMVVHRGTGQIEHRTFRDLAEYLRPGDLLILNQTRVIPARLFGRKAKTGGKVELLLLHPQDDQLWEALVRGKKLRPGTVIELQAPAGRTQDGSPITTKLGPDLGAEIVAETESGGRLGGIFRPKIRKGRSQTDSHGHDPRYEKKNRNT